MQLIDYLIRGSITHPAIAQDIVAYAGGGDVEFDAIVHKKHKGKYRARRRARPVAQKKEAPPRKFKEVVALDREGRVLHRYKSAYVAANELGISETPIRIRCNCSISDRIDEFKSFGKTFRYADKWDAMDKEEKMENIRRCKREQIE